jgi:16S rRNA (guanine527-N7)-methyltransferase
VSAGSLSGDGQRLPALLSALGLSASAAQQEQLLAYLALLTRWNRSYNLTAIDSPQGMWIQHLADCLAVLPPLDRQLQRGRVLDVGSGGGLPGVLIALMRPSLEVVCIDPVGKKAAFVRQVAAELGLHKLHAVHGRVEAQALPPAELITARAFATLADLVRLSRSRLAPGGVWMAMKGKRPDGEMASLPTDVAVFHVEPLAVPGLAAERCLVWMKPQEP